MQDFNNLSTPQLRQQQRWHEIALLTVLFGMVFALSAAGYVYFRDGVLQTTLCVTCLFAAAAAYPVYLQRIQLLAVVRQRRQ